MYFATFSISGGTLTINFTSSTAIATTALVNEVLQHITYTNTSDAPPTSVTLDYTFNDGSPDGGQGTGALAIATGSTIVNINAVDDAPVAANAIVDQNATQGAAFAFTVPANTFTDPDVGDTLTLSATLANGSALPSWLSFNAATGAFSGTPANGDVGTISVKVTASLATRRCPTASTSSSPTSTTRRWWPMRSSIRTPRRGRRSPSRFRPTPSSTRMWATR